MKKLIAMLLALMMVVTVLSVAAFAEPTDQPTETDEPTDIVVDDPKPEKPADNNPTTGLAVAVLPLVLAGAAVAFGKKH